MQREGKSYRFWNSLFQDTFWSKTLLIWKGQKLQKSVFHKNWYSFGYFLSKEGLLYFFIAKSITERVIVSWRSNQNRWSSFAPIKQSSLCFPLKLTNPATFIGFADIRGRTPDVILSYYTGRVQREWLTWLNIWCNVP